MIHAKAQQSMGLRSHAGPTHSSHDSRLPLSIPSVLFESLFWVKYRRRKDWLRLFFFSSQKSWTLQQTYDEPKRTTLSTGVLEGVILPP